MKYEHTVPATFIERPNRFIAYARLNDRIVTCHVKNTGRCKELLTPNADVILQHHPDAQALGRKTEYSLIQVYKQVNQTAELINMDSQAPNQVAFEWFAARTDISELRREVTFGNSRFDLAFCHNGKPAFAEVKGVTLEAGGIARFPDAPTIRGVKHLYELAEAVQAGYEAYAFFVVAMKGIRCFEPNTATHPEFTKALSYAAAHGVKVLAYDCITKPDSLVIDRPVPIILNPSTDCQDS